MTASKDMSRPSSQHRLSVGSNAASLPLRGTYSRSHSHTASLGSAGSSHRINRRKSSTFSPAAHAAVIGAVESATADGSLSNRRSSVSKAALASLNDGGFPSMPSSLPHHVSMPENNGSAVVDGPALSSFQSIDKTKQRMRRASDGTRLTKKEKAANGDLKCDTCGKAYKHGSCLSKHRWEHTPQWQYTSKLLISKHQQVQLLEAASVLVAMNSENPAATHDSDNSSSPAASGSSERDEELSSAETTPPPQADNGYRERDSKRYSNTSSAYSRSYQSTFSFGSVPNGENGFAHRNRWSFSSNRPQTANTSITDEDPQDQEALNAAVSLLSCSHGTPKTAPTGMPNDDVPPVPPLPEKYANAFSAYRRSQEVVMMDEDDDDDSSEDEARQHPRMMHHDEHEPFFGKMDA